MATPGALDSLLPEDVLLALDRHVRGDWGEVDEHDQGQNDFAYENGLRLLSAYTSSTGVRFWVITEADRSATTVLLPDEY